MFRSIRSLIVTAICLLVLGPLMATPSPVFAAPTAETADAPFAAIPSDPGEGITVTATLDSGGLPIGGYGFGSRVWSTRRDGVGSGPPIASGPLATSYSVPDGGCDVERNRFWLAAGGCGIGFIPVAKAIRIAKGAAKGAKAGKSAKGTKGDGDKGSGENGAGNNDGFNLKDYGLGALSAFFCADAWDSFWEWQTVRRMGTEIADLTPPRPELPGISRGAPQPHLKGTVRCSNSTS